MPPLKMEKGKLKMENGYALEDCRLFLGNAFEERFQAVERRFPVRRRRVKHLAKIFDGIRHAAHGFGQGRSAGVGVTPALEFLRHRQRFPATAPQTDNNGAIRPPEKRD